MCASGRPPNIIFCSAPSAIFFSYFLSVSFLPESFKVLVNNLVTKIMSFARVLNRYCFSVPCFFGDSARGGGRISERQELLLWRWGSEEWVRLLPLHCWGVIPFVEESQLPGLNWKGFDQSVSSFRGLYSIHQLLHPGGAWVRGGREVDLRDGVLRGIKP